jgi:hypothetical protein
MKTNKQVINALTKDVLDQAFVISAVEYYSKAVLADGGDEWSANAFINYDLWKTMAEHSLKTIENRSK